ncbi:MAG: M14 metallopeptidase family protein [Planctomycetota bacterium]
MPRLACLLFLGLMTAATLGAQSPLSLSYYLPADTEFDPAIPKPAEVLGWEPGTWHVRHDQVISYMKVLAEKSDRVTYLATGFSHEQRELCLLAFSSPENHRNLEKIREEHLRLMHEPAAIKDKSQMPVITWLGYGVHGNESSATNAAIIVAYILAAAKGEVADRLLKESVVLLDPCLNPDGLSRFANWANMHRGKQLVGDPMNRDHREAWPSGRTNHYWFDLNRDWLLLRHPESKARVEQFHRWMPNILTDHHEMGTNSSFFFQAGVRARGNPLTPAKNFELTAKIAKFHAKRLDQIGSLYFTEEQFDDFYYGKGSTYPDVHGGIGILFEQASSRGHLQESVNGDLSFPFTIKNQVTVSLSTLEAAVQMRGELLDWQAEFYRRASFVAAADPVKAWVFGDVANPKRNFEALEVLARHDILVYGLAKDFEQGGLAFKANETFIVPAAQPQYRLAKALFERRTEFEDETFYDVSAWTLPLAFDLPFAEVGAEVDVAGLCSQQAVTTNLAMIGQMSLGPEAKLNAKAVAFAYDWRKDEVMPLLAGLLKQGLRVRVNTKSFTAATPEGPKDFGYGAIIVPLGIQDKKPEEVRAIIAAASRRLPPHAILGGLTEKGVDLGSSSLVALEEPKLALIVGRGVSAYEAGEVWHLLDQQMDLGVSLLQKRDLARAPLGRYTHLLMVGGSYSDLKDATVTRVKAWVRDGGIIITSRSAATWAGRSILGLKPAKAGSASKAKKSSRTADAKKPDAKKKAMAIYADRGKTAARRRISGAIFQASIDFTHPLGYGYEDGELALFKNSTAVMAVDSNAVRDVVRYTADPLLAGFASDNKAKAIAGTAAVNHRRLGRGAVVRIIDNLNFRAWWRGGTRLYMNAIYFAKVAAGGGRGEDAESGAEGDHGHEHAENG